MTPSIDDYDCVIFDCDGVLYHAEEVIPGAIETIQKLRDAGKHVYFVTNASKRCRREFHAKFERLGFNVDLEQCYPSGFFCAEYLRSQYPKSRDIFVVGGTGVVNELELGGFSIIHANIQAPHNVEMSDEVMRDMIATTPLVDGVVVGFDTTFSYERLCRASLALQRNPKAFLCVTNEDAFVKLDGYCIPGNGAIATSIRYCLETACGTGRDYIVTGKPDPRIVDFILEKCNVDKSRCLMVGDRLDTDIALACNAKISGCLVLSGCAKAEEVEAASTKPTYVVASVADLF